MDVRDFAPTQRLGCSQIEALAVLKAAMDAAYSASSLATKHAGWRVVGPGGERLNAKDFVGLVVDMMVGEGKGEGNGVRAAGEKKKGGRRKSESGKGK